MLEVEKLDTVELSTLVAYYSLLAAQMALFGVTP